VVAAHSKCVRRLMAREGSTPSPSAKENVFD
jgi:hypothetical protein